MDIQQNRLQKIEMGGVVLTVDPIEPIKATLHNVGEIKVYPWGRGLYSLLADHVKGVAPLDQLEFWMASGDTPERVVLEFDHRLDWRISPTTRVELGANQTETIKAIMKEIYAQARGED